MPINKNSQTFSALLVSLAASLWAFDGIVFRPNFSNLPVSLVVLIESIIVAILLIPILFKYRLTIMLIKIRDWLAFVGVAILGGAVGTMSITKAFFFVDYINLSIVVFIQKLQPVFAISLAAIFLKEKLSKSFIGWATAAILGAYIITFGLNLPEINSDIKTLEASLYALVASISYGSSTVLSKRALKNVPVELATYLRFLLTVIIMSFIVFISSTYESITQINSSQVLLFFLIAISIGGPGILVYYYGLKKLNASVATICELAFPLTAILLEYFLHNKIFSQIQWLGAIILTFSILKVSGVNFYKNKRQNS